MAKLENETKKLLELPHKSSFSTEKLEELIEKVGESDVIIIPGICKETLMKKNNIIPRCNKDLLYPKDLIREKNMGPYCISNPSFTKEKRIRIGEILDSYKRNPEEYMNSYELLICLFLKKVSLNGATIFVPREGQINGMLIWHNGGEYQGMIDGNSRRMEIENVSIPICERKSFF